MDLAVVCPSCARTLTFPDLLPFRAECESCAADLHVCVTCKFHDRYVENECRETQAEYVSTKDRRNLCEYWKPRAVDDDATDPAAEAKRKLAALFGDKTPSAQPVPSGSSGSSATTPSSSDVELSPAEEAKRKLEALFKK